MSTGSARRSPRTSTSSTTRPSTRFEKQNQIARDPDPGPRLAAAAVRARPDREADARPVLRHDRARHGRGRDQRHDRDRQDLPADQDRAEAPRAADPRVRLERPDRRREHRRCARAASPELSPRRSGRRRAPRARPDRRSPRRAASARSALAAAGAGLGNQRRNGFRCVLESVRQKFTLFSPDGVPLRATLTVTLREYKTLAEPARRAPPELARPHPRARAAAGRDAGGGVDALLRHAGDWRDDGRRERHRRPAATHARRLPARAAPCG